MHTFRLNEMKKRETYLPFEFLEFPNLYIVCHGNVNYSTYISYRISHDLFYLFSKWNFHRSSRENKFIFRIFLEYSCSTFSFWIHISNYVFHIHWILFSFNLWIIRNIISLEFKTFIPKKIVPIFGLKLRISFLVLIQYSEVQSLNFPYIQNNV